MTNTSVNPLRSTAPAAFVGDWAIQQLWLFWVAPVVGAALAGFVHKAVLEGPVVDIFFFFFPPPSETYGSSTSYDVTRQVLSSFRQSRRKTGASPPWVRNRKVMPKACPYSSGRGSGGTAPRARASHSTASPRAVGKL